MVIVILSQLTQISQYRGKLHLRRHYVVPDPYIWDESFAVGVQQMDDEHVGLFNIVRDVCTTI